MTGNGRRGRPRGGSIEIQTCAPCHSRRGELGGEVAIGAPLGDGYRLALLDDGLYFDDGQNRDEVYEYGSFLQSRMNQAGVTCSDCHDPHSLELRAEGSLVCLQCHGADRYWTEAAHHHRDGSRGAACVGCHMPSATFMVVDERHDHSFRIPRPDRSMTIGTPNPCTGCHPGRSARWAAERVRAWFGEPEPGFQRFAEALHASAEGAPGASRELLGVASDPTQPAIARASALARLERIPDADALDVVRRLLGDVDPLVRRAAASAYQGAPSSALRDLLPLCDDPVRDVRLEAARRIAALPARELGRSEQGVRERAIEAYLGAQRAQLDRPEAQLNLGGVLLDLGRGDAARVAFEQALALDPTFAPAAVNLADVLRELGRDPEAEAVLRRALTNAPSAAALHHALGLWLVRAKRVDEALAELGRAAELAPREARFAFVHGLALRDTGKLREARRVLERALQRHPYDRNILEALAAIERGAGRTAEAERLERMLAEIQR